MRTIITLLLIQLASATAFAENPEIVLGSVGKTPTAGKPIILPVYFHNTGDTPISVTLEPDLPCRLASQERTVEAVALNMESDAATVHTIEKNSFLKVRYTIRLPEDLDGNIRLSLPGLNDSTIYFKVVEAFTEDESASAWIPRSTDQPMDTLMQLYQPYVKNISFYEPMYFLVGTEPEYSKFQISLKYRFFDTEKASALGAPWMQGFHFGYTQTSFWDLESDSAPFEDTSYKPELFYISQRLKTEVPMLDAVFLKAGVRHESNGRGGDLSRSTNTAYIEPIFIFYNQRKHTGLKVAPRLWAYFRNEDENNPDIDRYRGHFNLEITLGAADSWVLNTNAGLAAEGGSVQMDLTYPLHNIIYNPLDIYVQAQYVNRLAESLLNYTRRTEVFRLGFAIVR